MSNRHRFSGVSVVIPYHRKEVIFRACLQSLVRHHPVDLPLQIIVIINDDRDEKPWLPEEVMDHDIEMFRVPRSPNRYRSPGILWNLGASIAKHPVVALSHPDIYHFGNTLEIALRHLPLDGVYATACRSLRIPSTAWSEDEIHAWLESPEKVETATFYDEPGLRGWYAHGRLRQNCFPWCLVLARDLFTSLGGFDFRYDDVVGCEDADFNVTILNALTPEKIVFGHPDVGAVGHVGHERPERNYAPAMGRLKAKWGEKAKWVRDG